MMLFFIFFLNAQPINAPSAKELCLKEAVALNKILSSSDCKWAKKKKDQVWPSDCQWPLQCEIQDSTNVNFQFCPNGVETKDTPWSESLIQSLYEQEENMCKAESTHLKRCRYVPEQKDGIAVGDDPGYSDENCKIQLKKNPTSSPR